MTAIDSELLPSNRLGNPVGDAPLGRLFEISQSDSEERFLLKVVDRAALDGQDSLIDETRRLTRIYSFSQAALLRVEESDDEMALLFEWPSGQHLDHVLAEAGFGNKPDEVGRGQLLEWARQLAAQLAEAHSIGILHRSISPPAMWIGVEGAVLIGFALAAVTFQPEGFRPPEVAGSTPLDPGHSEQGDLFSLARVLLTAAQRAGVVLEAQDPFRLALERCLAPDPSQRWSDAARLERALREAPEPWTGAVVPDAVAALPTPVATPASPPAATAPPPEARAPSWTETSSMATIATWAAPPELVSPPPTDAAQEAASATAEAAGGSGWAWLAALILIAMAVALLWYRGFLPIPGLPGAPADTTGTATPAAAQEEIGEERTFEGRADETSPGERVPTAAELQPEDDALTLARNLISSSGEDLYGERGSDGDYAEDETLTQALAEDLAELRFEDDPRAQETAQSLFGENPLTLANNPLLDAGIRQRWLAEAIRNVGDRQVLEHLTAEAEHLRQGEVTLAEWYEHVAACETVCNLVVLGLLQEHIRKVQELPHTLALYEAGRESLTASERTKVEDFLQQAGDDSTWLLLIGRASRVGDRTRNRELSRRRVENARQMIAELGIDPDRIETIWLGYEPPQITKTLAQRYGLNPRLDEQTLNQSLMVVAHRPPA